MQTRIVMHTMARIILGALFSISLSSCAGAPLETAMSRYNEARASCNGYGEFDYEKLEMPDKKVFWIDENSMVFVFDSGKSYFKAFELPKSPPPYSILIRSYQIGSSIKTAYVFRPAVMFLDERFNVTRFLDKYYFHYTSVYDMASLNTGWTRALEGEIHVYKENANEKYMVVLTTDNLLNEKESFMRPGFVPFILPGAVGALPTGRVDVDYISHSPTGKLKVTVRPMERK